MAISLEDIRNAAKRIQGAAVETPALQNAMLNRHVGAEIILKPENLQRTGSFKFRGAYNRLAQLTSEQKSAGVVAWSSGNHAQGISAAAEILDVPATIIMPHDAPSVKIAKTKMYGAEVIGYDRYTESREEIGRRLSEERGAVLVPSYDDPHIIAGQGTTGLELAQQVKELDATLDILLVCCGGGGLIAGMASAFSYLSPSTKIYSVEPEGFDDHARSLASGSREKNDPNARSICDALLAPEPGALTFPVNSALLAGGLVVSDEEVKAAMEFAFNYLKMVVEPGGAVALAAALSSKLDIKGKLVGVVISGGNVDPTLFADVIQTSSSVG
ncbi:MAG: threonine/serine dehydratase [Pseudomonadota bacterium]